MHELVHHTFHSRLLSALRLPSLAGNGLPERMRSISFALLGMTAAAGLALVAIFAQPSFPLLAPAPLPAEPSAQESVSAAKKLQLDHGSVALLTALPAPAHPHRGGAQPKEDGSMSGTPVPAGSDGGSGENQLAPAAVDTPAPVTPLQPSSGNNGGGGAGGGAGGGSAPATATPQPPAATPSPPASSPQPTNPKPEAITSSPKPEFVPAPGNSSSTAAAEHASERGIEASAGAGPPASTAAAGSVPEPESSASPGNGNGLAKGHDTR